MAEKARRILFIERKFQKRFIAGVIGVVLVGTLLTGGFMYLFGDYQISRMYSSAHMDVKTSWQVFRSAVFIACFVSMSMVALLAVLLTLRESNRIGGPLYRFRENLKTIAEGDLTLHTQLREIDELKPLVGAMNEMTEALCERVQAVKAAVETLERATAGARAQPGDVEAWRAVAAARGELRRELEELRTSQ